MPRWREKGKVRAQRRIELSRLRYVEFGTARRMLTTVVFRHMLKRRICLARLETRLVAARSVEESWLAIREAASEFKFSYLHLRLAGAADEEVCAMARSSKPGSSRSR